MWVLPFQTVDLEPLLKDATGTIHVESIWVMRFGTLTGVRSISASNL